MPRSCTICSNGELALINRYIVNGGTKRSTAERFNVGEQSVQRHRRDCLRMAPRGKARATTSDLKALGTMGRNEKRSRGTQDSDPAPTVVDAEADLAPQALLRRAALQLDDADRDYGAAEGESQRAQARRDRREALRLVMLAKGMLQPDGATTVHVDARAITFETAVAQLPSAVLEVIRMGPTDLECIEAVRTIEAMRAIALQGANSSK